MFTNVRNNIHVCSCSHSLGQCLVIKTRHVMVIIIISFVLYLCLIHHILTVWNCTHQLSDCHNLLCSSSCLFDFSGYVQFFEFFHRWIFNFFTHPTRSKFSRSLSVNDIELQIYYMMLITRVLLLPPIIQWRIVLMRSKQNKEARFTCIYNCLWSLNLHQTLLQFVFYDDDNLESHDEHTSTQTAAATKLVISYISNHSH